MNTLSKTYESDIVSKTQLQFLAQALPQPALLRGRPAYSNTCLLPGILFVLRSGCRWKDLDLFAGPRGVTHWRRLQFWQRSGEFLMLWKYLLACLVRQQKLQLFFLSIDGTFIPSFAFRDGTGYSGKEKRTGVKISAVVDGEGVPIAAVRGKGNMHDRSFVHDTFTSLHVSYGTIQKSTVLADKGYDSSMFRTFLTQRGLIPHVMAKKYRHHQGDAVSVLSPPKTAGDRRFVVERTHAWLKNNRRLRFRFDRTTQSFTAFVQLAILLVLVKRFMV